MKRIKYLLLFLVIQFNSTALADDDEFKQLFVFGDSLSDTGNFASVVGPLPFPFYMNRISNGPVAVETFAQALGLPLNTSLHLIGPAVGNNYAVTSARAVGGSILDLGFQANLFFANHGGAAPADALYFIMLGGNDIRDARDTPDAEESAAIIQQAVQNISDFVVQLHQAGARNFFVANAPDIGGIPETRIIAQLFNQPALVDKATALSRAYARQLRKSMHRLEQQLDIEIYLFDVLKNFERIKRRSERLGFNNDSDPCFFTETQTPNPQCDFATFIYFDEIHPTARVHQLIGRLMAKRIKDDD